MGKSLLWAKFTHHFISIHSFIQHFNDCLLSAWQGARTCEYKGKGQGSFLSPAGGGLGGKHQQQASPKGPQGAYSFFQL